MPGETIGEQIHIVTANHPDRKDSSEYTKSRKWLMSQAGGCYVCGGPVDMTHPEASPAISASMEDHHGGGIFFRGVLVGFNLFGMEWSLGWSADPVRVQAHVNNLNAMLKALGLETWDEPITDTAAVMAFTDSIHNASVKLCRSHHIGTQTEHTPDANGHEAVGIHEIPFPIWLLQVHNDWSKWDPFAGSTGTLAVTKPDDGSKTVKVIHVHDSHPGNLKRGDILPATHGSARAAHAGISI